MPLRPYQSELIKNTATALALGKRKVVVQLPTGGGKTVIFANIMARYWAKSKKPIIVLVHRKRLLQQTADTIKKWFGIEPMTITADDLKIEGITVPIGFYSDAEKPLIYVAMIETLNNRLKLSAYSQLALNTGMLIVDECHRGEFRKVYDYFPNSYIIGFSATPIPNKKYPLHNDFEDIIVGTQIKHLISIGALVQNYTYVPKDILRRETLKIAANGEFDAAYQSAERRKVKYIQTVVDCYWEEVARRGGSHPKTMCFNVNIEHNREVCNALNTSFEKAGIDIKAVYIDSEDPDACEAIMEEFSKAKVGVLCNVDMATTGVDIPDVECIMVNISTTSLAKWLQICGRGGRPYEDGEWYIKKRFTIIDLGGNVMVHDDWNADRNWREIFFRKYVKKEGVAPVKICPKCNGAVHAAVAVCNLPPLQYRIEYEGMYSPGTADICGHIFEKKMIIDTGGTELIEIGVFDRANALLQFIGKEVAKRDLAGTNTIYQIIYFAIFAIIDKKYSDEVFDYAIEKAYYNHFTNSPYTYKKFAETARRERNRKLNKYSGATL